MPITEDTDLTLKELELLDLLSRGLSNQAIASELVVGLGTVADRALRVYGKLGISNNAQVNKRVWAVLWYQDHTNGRV